MDAEEKRLKRNAYAREWRKKNPGSSSKYTNAHYHANKETRRAQTKRWQQANREHLLQKQMEWRDKDRRHALIISSRANAKKRGFEHNITTEDLEWPTHCPLLGVELNYMVRGHDLKGISIDRIDSSKGYIKGNVQVISKQANSMKYCASLEELVTFAQNVLRIYA